MITECSPLLEKVVVRWLQTSGSQHFLHHVTGHVVQEESQDGQQQQSGDNLDGQPPVLVTHQVFRGFERDEEPEEGNVRPAGGAQRRGQNVKDVKGGQQHNNSSLAA